MKRALLITSGTLGSLAAVFAITPPQIATNQTALDLGNAGTTPTTTATPTKSATTGTTGSASVPATSTPTKKATPTKNSTKPTEAAAAPTKTTTPTQAPPAPTPTAKSVSGTFTGDLSNVGPFGGVVTQITVASGKITDIQVLQAPGGQNQRYTDRAIPTMRQRALAAQGDQISAVSGASYTSYNFWKSLGSALTKAGLK